VHFDEPPQGEPGVKFLVVTLSRIKAIWQDVGGERWRVTSTSLVWCACVLVLPRAAHNELPRELADFQNARGRTLCGCRIEGSDTRLHRSVSRRLHRRRVAQSRVIEVECENQMHAFQCCRRALSRAPLVSVINQVVCRKNTAPTRHHQHAQHDCQEEQANEGHGCKNGLPGRGQSSRQHFHSR
jgi:hypothetical protein